MHNPPRVNHSKAAWNTMCDNNLVCPYSYLQDVYILIWPAFILASDITSIHIYHGVSVLVISVCAQKECFENLHYGVYDDSGKMCAFA